MVMRMQCPGKFQGKPRLADSLDPCYSDQTAVFGAEQMHKSFKFTAPANERTIGDGWVERKGAGVEERREIRGRRAAQACREGFAVSRVAIEGFLE